MRGSSQDFSSENLRHIYRLSLDLGYRPLIFGQETTYDGPYILWRHDIDLELPAVVTMAELEAQQNIRSTYFLMTRSWFYNLFSWEGLETVQRLKELGHTIGLHCDLHLPRQVEVSDAEVEKRVAQEFALVDVAFPGAFQRIVSFHNPPNSIYRRTFNGFYSVYQAKFFSEVKYLSDSNRHWRDGPPEEWFDVNLHPRLSILLHPVIWAYPGHTMPEGMQAYLEEHQNRRRTMLKQDDVHI
jgi:hypothetical protein